MFPSSSTVRRVCVGWLVVHTKFIFLDDDDEDDDGNDDGRRDRNSRAENDILRRNSDKIHAAMALPQCVRFI